MADNSETIRHLYDALLQGDIQPLLGIIAPNAEWTLAEGFPYGGTYIGPDEVLEKVFMKLGAEWDGWSAVPHEFIADGDTVIVLGEYSGTYKSTGKSFKASFAHSWKLREGKAAVFRQYTDTAIVQRSMT